MERLLVLVKKALPSSWLKFLRPPYHYLLSFLAALLYGFPSRRMLIIGVTGTTGKTTVVYMIARMLREAGIKTGYTSTAMFGDGEREWLNERKMTMSGRFFTQKILRKMLENGCKAAVVETTSEGIVQFRHRFIDYDLCVFTGIYPEHIQSHGSFDAYKAAKLELFAHLARTRVKEFPAGEIFPKTIVANADDGHYREFIDFPVERKIGVSHPAVEFSEKGVSFVFEGEKINLSLLGEFNAFNAALAAAVGRAAGLSVAQIKKGLESIEGIPGRLERLVISPKVTALVDYAFEPVALEKLYQTVGVFGADRIIHILGGTGGGRDRDRRPVMGALAAAKADAVIVTNEDPYDEDPRAIIDEVFAGAVENSRKKEGKDIWRIDNRAEAINFGLRKALEMSSAGEKVLVLITGKGCETSICVRDGEKIPHDDRR
ncbi:MAG TPA: UDP-N-acetylmuramyl-tripeptide synthetase, partial [Candidatus Moranbacteria bacterium]|nr:UDP-N-acetylmuramyl-tripeptide synthetase [Candidatus Moranbacteria bacterium]